MKTEYSKAFDEKRNGLIEQSYYKYGPARMNFSTGNVDAIESLKMNLAKFEETGNLEYLCDVANYAMFRFMFPQKGEYFKHTNPYGICWTFSVLAACEASMIRNGLATGSIDLSERHLAYYFYNKGNTTDDSLPSGSCGAAEGGAGVSLRPPPRHPGAFQADRHRTKGENPG